MGWIKVLGRLLEKDLRTKNVACLLVAGLAVAFFYLGFKDAPWFQEIITKYGNVGLAITIVVVFLITFCGTWVVHSGLSALRRRSVSRRKEQYKAEEARNSIRATLFTLTPWQKKFLLRFVQEGRTQIPEWEVGEYKAAWDFEMEVLLSKRIVREISGSGVYEISPIYHDYLIRNWRPETGDLE